MEPVHVVVLTVYYKSVVRGLFTDHNLVQITAREFPRHNSVVYRVMWYVRFKTCTPSTRVAITQPDFQTTCVASKILHIGPRPQLVPELTRGPSACPVEFIRNRFHVTRAALRSAS